LASYSTRLNKILSKINMISSKTRLLILLSIEKEISKEINYVGLICGFVFKTYEIINLKLY